MNPNRRFRLPWLVVLLALPLSAQARSKACPKSIEHGRRLERAVTVDGHPRTYLLDVPDGIEPGRRVPLMFDFHGFGHSGAGVWNVSQFKEIAAQKGFIAVYPEGENVHLLDRDAPGWDIFHAEGNRDLAFVRAMLAEIERDYCVDPRRIYSTGFSNGAFFSHLLACTMADRIAAIAPVSGGTLALPCSPVRPVPVLIHHGRKDPLVKIERARALRDVWIAKNDCRSTRHGLCEEHGRCRAGAVVEYCEDDGEHHWPAAASQRIWEFFEAHPLPAVRR